MQLPMAPQSNLPTPEALLRALRSAEVILGRTVAEETQLEGATVFTNPLLPAVAMANCARMVRVPEGSPPARVVEQILAHFAQLGLLCRHLTSNTAPWPQELAREIERHGYRAGPLCELHLLGSRHPPRHTLAELQVIPGRAAYGEVAALARDAAMSGGQATDAQADQVAAANVDQLNEPHLESFLGRLNGQPAGIVNVLTIGPIGVIDWLYVTPALRRRGVAGRLLDHALDYCRRAQFAQVILEARQGSEAIALYQSLGFAAVAEHRGYVRTDPP